MLRFVSRWFTRATPVRTRKSLRLETLEDRMTPATFVLQGDTLLVTGTEGADSFKFTAGTTSHTATMNGESYTIDPSQISTIVVDGLGGTDSSELNAGEGADTLVLDPTGGVLIGSNYLVSLTSFEENTANGQSDDYAILNDSVGNDTFVGSPTQAALYGGGFINVANGFGSVDGVAGNGGSDLAILNDSVGNDTFTSVAGYASMQNSVNSYFLSASSFAEVQAIATTGDDIAYFFDSAGVDSFAAFPTIGVMNYSGGAIASASGFNAVSAFLNSNDTGYFFGTTQDENLFANSVEASLQRDGFISTIIGGNITADLTQGGADKAFLYDSMGDDTLTASGGDLVLTAGRSVNLTGFESVEAQSIFGGTDTQFITAPLGFILATEGFVNG